MTALARHRSVLLNSVLLGLSLLLSGCGLFPSPVPTNQSGAASGVNSAGVNSAGVNSAGVGHTGSSTLSSVVVTAAVLESGAALEGGAVLKGGQAQASVWLAGVSPAQLSATLELLPAGLQVQFGAAVAQDGGARLPLTVSGAISAPSSLRLRVRVGSRVQSVSVPVWPLRSYPLALPGFQASSARVAEGQVQLIPAVNAPDAQRRRLVRLNGVSGAVQVSNLALSEREGLTSQALGPDGAAFGLVQNLGGNWVAPLGVPSGSSLRKLPLGTPGNNLNNLTRTPDGHLWALQYRADALFELDPLSGKTRRHPVTGNAEDLTLGEGGRLYYSRFPNSPAILQFDPASGAERAFPLPQGSRAYPRLITAGGGAVYFMDAWSRKVFRLDPQTGSFTALTLPPLATVSALSAAPDGRLWASDLARHALYTWETGASEPHSILLGDDLPGDDGPHALQASQAGEVWFQRGGALYRLRSN